MSWRTVVISSRAKLDFKMNYLVVRGDSVKKVHLSEISLLLIENTAVSLTAYLLCELTKRKIKVIFCDEKRQPSSELVSYYGSHDTSSKIREQIKWTKENKAIVWTAIVEEKIWKQKIVLEVLGHHQHELLGEYIHELTLNDESNREGHAAKVYFNALFGMGFSRDAPFPINAALNYGYAIILSAFNREIVSNGYVTQLGIFHDNIFNPFNFGSDLMETFRPLVDYEVVRMDPQELGRTEKMQLVDILNQEVQIDGKRQYVSNAIKIYCKSVFRALQNGDASEIRRYRNEL